MRASKLILALLCWAILLPAMGTKKELSIYEQAIELYNLTSAQKAKSVIDYHNQSIQLLQLPDECLDHIAQNIFNNISRVQEYNIIDVHQSEDKSQLEQELKNAIHTFIALKHTCYRFNTLLSDKCHQKKLSECLLKAITKKQSLFIINLLIKAGADISEQDDDGYTALINATIVGYTDVIKLLIKAGVDLDKQAEYGNTALMAAVANEDINLVSILLNASANISIKDWHGHTVFNRTSNTKIIQLLEDKATTDNQTEQSKK